MAITMFKKSILIKILATTFFVFYKSAIAMQNLDTKLECAICFDKKTSDNFNILKCGHSYCNACLKHIIDLAIQEKIQHY